MTEATVEEVVEGSDTVACLTCGREFVPEPRSWHCCSPGCDRDYTDMIQRQRAGNGHYATTWGRFGPGFDGDVVTTSLTLLSGERVGGAVSARGRDAVFFACPTVLNLLDQAARFEVYNLPVLADAVEETDVPGAAECAAALRTPGLEAVPF